MHFLVMLYARLGRADFLPTVPGSTRLEKALQDIVSAEYKWLEGCPVLVTLVKHSFTGFKELKVIFLLRLKRLTVFEITPH